MREQIKWINCHRTNLRAIFILIFKWLSFLIGFISSVRVYVYVPVCVCFEMTLERAWVPLIS